MTIYCATTSSGLGDGSSWDNAIGGIAAAIAAATTEEIWCKEGTYTLSAAITAKDGCDMFGSFSGALTGTDGTKAGRDFVNDVSVIDGVATYQLVELADSDWSGFRFYNGNTAVSSVRGSGVTCEISDCTFDSCANASNYGGASMIRDTSTVAFTRCVFTNCSAARGGAVAVRYTSPVTFTDCIFGTSGNGNSSTIEAGAVYVSDAGEANFVDCEIAYNSSPSGGAVKVVETGSTAELTRCKLHDNEATVADGGAIEANVGGVTATNCLFYDNESVDEGGAVKIGGTGGTGEFYNCIFEGNTAANYAVRQVAGTLTLVNCIVYGNTGGSVSSTGGTVSVTYSDVEGGFTGTGNINSDPLFVGTGDDPYALQATSPCIDAGDGDAAPSTDYLGAARVDVPTVTNTGTGTPAYTDIGAYEYTPAAPPLDVVLVQNMGRTVDAPPAEVARGCKFAENFRTAGQVVRNGGQVYGSVPIKDGADFDGVAGRAILFDSYQAFDKSATSVFAEFTPTFSPEDNLTCYMLDSEFADRSIWILALHTGPDNLLQIGIGGSGVFSVSASVFSQYWRKNQKNTLAFSGVPGANRCFLNGVLIATASTAWTQNTSDYIVVGARYDRTFQFRGAVHKVKIFDVALTDQELVDMHNDTTYNYPNECSLHLPMGMSEHDPDNLRTLDISGNDRHAQFGDGVTSSTFPTKTRRVGYDYDGDDFLRFFEGGADLITGDAYTVSIQAVPEYDLGTGGQYYLYDSTPNRFLVTIQTTGALSVYAGGTSVLGASLSAMAAFWKKGSVLNFVVVGRASTPYHALYMDGQLIAESATVWTMGSSTWWNIGSRYSSPYAAWPGQVKSFQVWPKALTPIQIHDLHLKTLGTGGQV